MFGKIMPGKLCWVKIMSLSLKWGGLCHLAPKRYIHIWREALKENFSHLKTGKKHQNPYF